MRVLHLGKYYPPYSGGIENFCAALLPELASRGLPQAALVHHHLRGETLGVQETDNVLLYRSPILGKFLFVPISPAFPFIFRSAVHDFKPDLLHLHMPNVSAFWALSGTFRDIPIVLHWHADVLASYFHRGLSLSYRAYRPFEQKLLARASAIVVTSPNYRDSSPSLRPWIDKCHVIPLGLTPQPTILAAPAGGPPWAFQRFKILCVGRLTYYKGHETLLRAAAGLANVDIFIVGTGECRTAIERRISELGVTDRVYLLGKVPDSQLHELLATCDSLCLPSIERTEAFGLVLLEAMRAGKPCVVTDVAGSGMSWVVQDGTTGLVTRCGDVESLSSALVQLRDDTQLCRSLGNAGRRRFNEHFTISKVAGQMVELYERILGHYRQ